MLSHHRTVPKISYHLGKDRNHEHQHNTQIETANASKIQQVVNNCRLNCWQCLFQVFFMDNYNILPQKVQDATQRDDHYTVNFRHEKMQMPLIASHNCVYMTIVASPKIS